MQAAAAASRVDSVMAAEAAADNADATNADATEVEGHVTAEAEAHTALTLVQAAAAAGRVDSVMAADAAADDSMNADATEVTATAGLHWWMQQQQKLLVLQRNGYTCIRR